MEKDDYDFDANVSPRSQEEINNLKVNSHHIKVQLNLGRRYEEGEGVEKSIFKAIKYYCDAKNNDDCSEKSRIIVEEKIQGLSLQFLLEKENEIEEIRNSDVQKNVKIKKIKTIWKFVEIVLPGLNENNSNNVTNSVDDYTSITEIYRTINNTTGTLDKKIGSILK